jgi:hypothetical protein
MNARATTATKKNAIQTEINKMSKIVRIRLSVVAAGVALLFSALLGVAAISAAGITPTTQHFEQEQAYSTRTH